MERVRKLVATTESTTYSAVGGEVIHEETTSIVKPTTFDAEPPFVKLYFDDIARLYECTQSQSNILMEFVKLMAYDNTIAVTQYHKELIAEKLVTTDGYIRNTISELVKKGIFIRLGQNVYRADPNLFGRGKWHDIKELRLNIKYDKHGKKIEGTRIQELPTEAKPE